MEVCFTRARGLLAFSRSKTSVSLWSTYLITKVFNILNRKLQVLKECDTIIHNSFINFAVDFRGIHESSNRLVYFILFLNSFKLLTKF